MFPRKYAILGLIMAALILRTLVFVFVVTQAPDSKLEFDSQDYLQTGVNMVARGKFENCDENNGCLPEHFRTPGYPLFLGVMHVWLRQSLNSVILIQILMTLGSGLLTYLMAQHIEPRVGLLCAAIVCFDPPIMIYSMMVLSESLFLLLLTIFMWSIFNYLKRPRTIDLILAGVCLTAAVYVRPIGYFLGIATAVFIVFANPRANLKASIKDAIILVAMVYVFLGIWHVRNHLCCGDSTFSTVTNATIMSQYATGMIHAYARDPVLAQQGINPAGFYLHMASRSLLQLMTDPGNFKYFGSPFLKIAGKIFGYPWMIFWLIGLVFGMMKTKQDRFLQFSLLLISYFLTTTILGAMLGSGPRFRVPMVPSIALIAGWGWMHLGTKKYSQR